MQDPNGDSRPGFFGNVAGLAVSLHELRAAQLLHVQLGLLDREYDAIVRSRLGTIVMYLRDFHDLPDFDDPELALSRLRLVVR